MPRRANTRACPQAESLEARALLTISSFHPPSQSRDSQLHVRRSGLQPQVINAHLVTRGDVATAITLTFDRPMMPGPVQDIRNYAVGDTSRNRPTPEPLALGAWLTGIGRQHDHTRKVPLKSASYDPATNTVTLVPTGLLKADGTYLVTSPHASWRPHRGQSEPPPTPITDSSGNALAFPFGVMVDRKK